MSRTALLCLLAAALLVAAASAGFRTRHLLEDHFARYGRQFGATTMQQYLRLAQQLRDSAVSKTILMSKRPDGGGSKFDTKRGWFVAYDGDGTLRTFFMPNDGIRYFQRQAKASVPPE